MADPAAAQPTALRAARLGREWTKSRLVHELQRRARARGIALPAAESVSRMIAAWENGHREPAELYRTLLCEVYGQTAAKLGLAKQSDVAIGQSQLPAQLSALVFTAGKVDTAAVRLLEGQTDQLRLLDRRLGAPVALAGLRAHVATVQRLLGHALLPGTRQPLAAVLADAATLAAWQALDGGRHEEAWRHYETARAAAVESGSPVLISHAMGEQTFALIDMGQPGLAVELVHAAQAQPAALPPLLRSWLRAAEAEACAAAGLDGDCLRALEKADRLLPGDCADPELPFLALDPTHLARWRGHCLARLGAPDSADRATRDLLAALDGMDGTFTRAEAGLRCDLAGVLLAQGHRDEAHAHAARAAELAEQVGSVREQRRLTQFLAA